MKSMPRNEMADLLRATFRKSGLSVKRLAIESGVAYASVHGFMAGDRDAALSTACRLCRVLGLELRPIRRRKKA